jgi:hypothetical protein
MEVMGEFRETKKEEEAVMGIKDILSKAKAVKKRADKAGDNLRTKLEKHKADSVADRARREAEEAKRLDEKLERLRKQEGRLKKREAINKKRREISALEAKVTVKGRILDRLGKEATKLMRQSKKPREKKRRRKQ